MKKHSEILTGLDKPAVIDALFCNELSKLSPGIRIHDEAVLVAPIRDDLGSDFYFNHQHLRLLKFVELLFGISQPFVVAKREFVAIFKQLFCLDIGFALEPWQSKDLLFHNTVRELSSSISRLQYKRKPCWNRAFKNTQTMES